MLKRKKTVTRKKEIMRIDSTLLWQANAYSFKSQAREIIMNLQKQEVSAPELLKEFEKQVVQAASQFMETEKKYQADCLLNLSSCSPYISI